MSWITTVWDDTFGSVEGDAKKVLDAIKKAIDWIDGQVTGLWHSINTKWSWIVSTFDTVEGEVASGLHGAAHAVRGWVDAVEKTIQGWVTAGLNGLKTFLLNIIHGNWVAALKQIEGVASGVTNFPAWVYAHVKGPIEKEIKALPGQLLKIAFTADKKIYELLVNMIRLDNKVWSPAVNYVNNEIKQHWPWLYAIVHNAEDFLVWIAKYEWHDIEATFELLLHPSRAAFLNAVKSGIDPIESALEHEVVAWLSA